MLESGPLSSKDFKEFSQKVVLFCHITSYVKGEKYQSLLSEKGGQGFPYLAFMDAEGNVIGKPMGRSVSSFEEGAKKAQAYLDLLNKKDKTKAEQLQLLEQQLDLGTIKAKAAKAKVKELGLDDAKQAELAKKIALLAKKEVDKEIGGLLAKAGIRSRADVPTKGPALGEKYWKLYQAGKRPHAKSAANYFYFFLIQYGLKAEKVKPVEIAIDAIEKLFGERAKPFVAMQRKKLEELKAKLAKKDGKKESK